MNKISKNEKYTLDAFAIKLNNIQIELEEKDNALPKEQRKGKTQIRKELAEALECSPNTFDNIKRGRAKIKPTSLISLANYASTTPNDLLDYTSPNSIDEFKKIGLSEKSIETLKKKSIGILFGTPEKPFHCILNYIINQNEFLEKFYEIHNPLLKALRDCDYLNEFNSTTNYKIKIEHLPENQKQYLIDIINTMENNLNSILKDLSNSYIQDFLKSYFNKQ